MALDCHGFAPVASRMIEPRALAARYYRLP